VAILNDSPHVLKLLCDWFRHHGHHCATQMVAEWRTSKSSSSSASTSTTWSF